MKQSTGDGLTTMYSEACQSQVSFVAGVEHTLERRFPCIERADNQQRCHKTPLVRSHTAEDAWEFVRSASDPEDPRWKVASGSEGGRSALSALAFEKTSTAYNAKVI